MLYFYFWLFSASLFGALASPVPESVSPTSLKDFLKILSSNTSSLENATNSLTNATPTAFIPTASPILFTSAPANKAAELRNAEYANGTVVLRSNDFLLPNTSYYSPSRTFRLILQPDQNLVLYRECDGRPVFSTETAGSPPLRMSLGNDGHLLVGKWGNGSDPDRPELLYWSTETWGYGNSRLLISDFGYFYLCNDNKCYWRSTRISGNGQGCGTPIDLAPAQSTNYTVLMKTAEKMRLDCTYYSPNGEFTFQLSRLNKHYLVVWRQRDYRQTFKAAGQKVIDRIAMQKDGNLVVYNAPGNAVWSSLSSASGHVNPELRLYNDGFLYLCDDNHGC
ncbi:uncharacterized protein LOC129592537 [Paramacrobiotus metropolitanus]|uniref:uncharacterized protein LOC129592537 n=1 Tax=Paramacrobiotus metropolitanus TaxID=2943436 RepID=UPI002445E7DC|nr:uncharacterized protein LOC129592537 [Paramacrobiotus metropolitanus]